MKKVLIKQRLGHSPHSEKQAKQLADRINSGVRVINVPCSLDFEIINIPVGPLARLKTFLVGT